ncbi:potassium channel family protein (plasmid) [Coraliomargarita sp. W4R53]
MPPIDIANIRQPSPRRVVILGLLRALASTTALVALYFVWPFDTLQNVPSVISMTLAGVVLLAISTWQIRAITRSPYPALRAIEALAVTVPLFLLLFAATYYTLAVDNPVNFNMSGLTRVDTLYFTVSIFSTVGFGDISAASEPARLVVTVQMILNLLVLGAGIRLFIGTAKRSRDSRQDLKPAPEH